MSSDRNGQKPDSQAPVSGVGHRTSARAPSAWGAVRDALAAVHNLEALLRSSIVPQRTILDLVPELRASAGVLRVAFERVLAAERAIAGVGEHGARVVTELDDLLDVISASPGDREALAVRTGALAGELEASTDLLALLDRGAAPISTEVSLNLVARESGRMSGTARGREMIIQFDEAKPDSLITTDPYVLGPILSLMVASVHASGVHAIVLRARSTPAAQFVVEPAQLEDAALATLSLRVTPWVPPSDTAARRVAEQLGAILDLGERRASIVLAHVGG